MKKSYIYVFLCLLTLISLNANAEHYQGPVENSYQKANSNSPYLGAQKLTVKDLSSEHDDDYVILEGYIVKKLKAETYLFQDSTGEIQIEIDHKRNYILENVNEKTLVEISGEYDKNMFEPDEIEVKNLKIIKQN